ncbi:unnamed protein product [Alopecurus aequalis]
MDEEDYSWVRRSRFSHSVVRSNSGREQFGAFVEQFNRGAALKQRGQGSGGSGFKLHGVNMEPTTTKTSAVATTNSANPPISFERTRSLDAKPKTDSESFSPDSKPMQQHGDHGHPSQAHKQQDGSSAGNGVFKGGSLFVDVCSQPEVQEPKDDSFGPLEFSFHPDEQSMRLQRVCSSPSPFPAKESLPAFEAPLPPPTRSSSLRVISEGRTPMLRARSPLPSRPVPQVFKEAKSASKRFSTPPPRRKSLSPPRAPPAAAPVRVPGKVKHSKESWDNARAKAAALKELDRWSVDRSKLLIGPKFASGAHSHLFHGIYMQVPVAVKFIRQPDDEEKADLASQLEKQFNTEIAMLSHLQHRNVIKQSTSLLRHH